MNRALLEAAGAGRTILAPNTELAAALFDALERAHRDSGREIWPTPRVRDFGGWLRERHARRQLADSSTPRCLTEVEERELWRGVVLERDTGEGFLDPSGAARAARRARRAMHEYAIPAGAVAADGSEESQMFLEWNARFEDRCRMLRCIDAGRLPMSLAGASAMREQGDESIVWIESPDWRPVARRWLQTEAGPPLPPSMPAALSAPGTPDAARLRSFGSRAAELAAMADWARQGLLASPGFRAWICVPDLAQCRRRIGGCLRRRAGTAALLPQSELSAQSAPYAVAGGTPLADYAPVRAALDLLAASSGAVSFTRFSALLRSPELQESTAEAGAAASLDVALRTRAPSEIPLSDWLELAQRVAREASAGPGRRIAAPADERTNPRGAARQSTHEPVGFPVDRRIRGRSLDAFAIDGRAANISRPNGFANCWRPLRPAIRCSALTRAGPPRAFCGAPRAIRCFKRRPGFRRSGSAAN